jgi:hypothetical protein
VRRTHTEGAATLSTTDTDRVVVDPVTSPASASATASAVDRLDGPSDSSIELKK